MKCPMIKNRTGRTISHNGDTIDTTTEATFGECIQDNCAWWVIDTESCAVVDITISLWNIAKEMKNHISEGEVKSNDDI